MTGIEIKKAKEELEFVKDRFYDFPAETGVSSDIENIENAINAINELEEYYTIGSIDECKEAREKQTPKKTGEPYINGYGNKKAECLSCHCTVMHPANYCKFCGQKLDWNEDEQY